MTDDGQSRPPTKYKYWLSQYAVSRVKKDQNFLMFIVGGTGTGKSLSAVSLGEDIDPNFSANNITFSTEEFLQVLDMGLSKGSVVIYDEAGVGIPKREWYRIQNKAIGYVLQTFRKDNIIVIFTTPNLNFIDKNALALVHGLGEMIDPTYTAGIFGFMNYKHVRIDPQSGKIYQQYPRIKDEHDITFTMKPKSKFGGNIKFNLPESKSLLNDYQHKANKFKDALKTSMYKLAAFQDIGEAKLAFEDILNLVINDPHRYMLDTKKETGDPESSTFYTSCVYTKLLIDYFGIEVKRANVKDVIDYVMSNGMMPKGECKTKLTEDDIVTIKRLKNPPLSWTNERIAQHFNVPEGRIIDKISSWKALGKW